MKPLSAFLAYLCLSNHFPTGSTARNTSNDLLEKWHNATEPSYLYVVQIELKAPRVEDSFSDLEKRLNTLVATAFALSSYKHRKQTPPAELPTSDSHYSTKMIKKRMTGDLSYLHFVTYAGNEPVLGEVVADDLTLLTVSQISAILRYPLGRIVSDRDIENDSATKWWFLIAVIGAGVIVVIIGWFVLFIIYNTCGHMFGNDEEEQLTSIASTKMHNEFTISDPEGCRPAAEQPIEVPSEVPNPIVITDKPRLNKKSAAMRTLSRIHLENQLRIERENFNKAMQVAFGGALVGEDGARVPLSSLFARVADTENTEVETKSVGRSEKKRRHTKIGPITTTTLATTTTTNEQEKKGETSEISRVSSSNAETMSTPAEDEFDVDNLPETSLKFVKKNKNPKDSDLKSEPESDYGSSLDDEKPRTDVINEKKKADESVESPREDTRVRPMTAKKQRTSLFGGRGIAPIPVQPRAWTVYAAGDKVAAFWNTNSMQSHPAPASPSENGIVEIKSTNSAFRF